LNGGPFGSLLDTVGGLFGSDFGWVDEGDLEVRLVTVFGPG